MTVAGGRQVQSPGQGKLVLPTPTGVELLPGAILLPGTVNLVSLAQLENAGYSVRMAPNQPVEVLRSNGSVCAIFHREGGRLIYRAKSHSAPVTMPRRSSTPASTAGQSRQVLPVSTPNWHQILGHPGPRSLTQALQFAGISGYKPLLSCAICDQAKMTTMKGHGTLRSSITFGEKLHFDLVGGRQSLSPSTVDDSPHWFLLAVDEATAWKWAWPIASKKEVTPRVQQLLDLLQVQHGVRPKAIHTDSGTEFLNKQMRSMLAARGIALSHASAKAPEQNGIVERNVRSITEKMRALRL